MKKHFHTFHWDFPETKTLGNRKLLATNPCCVPQIFRSSSYIEAYELAAELTEIYAQAHSEQPIKDKLPAVVDHNSRWRINWSKSELGEIWRRNYGLMWFVRPEIKDFW